MDALPPSKTVTKTEGIYLTFYKYVGKKGIANLDNGVDLTGWQDASLNNLDISGNVTLKGANSKFIGDVTGTATNVSNVSNSGILSTLIQFIQQYYNASLNYITKELFTIESNIDFYNNDNFEIRLINAVDILSYTLLDTSVVSITPFFDDLSNNHGINIGNNKDLYSNDKTSIKNTTFSVIEAFLKSIFSEKMNDNGLFRIKQYLFKHDDYFLFNNNEDLTNNTISNEKCICLLQSIIGRLRPTYTIAGSPSETKTITTLFDIPDTFIDFNIT